MFYVFESCTATREYIPALTYHETNPEDAQESGEATHCCDTDRYACTALPPVSDRKETSEQALLRKAEQNIMTFAGARKAARKDRRRSGLR